MMKTILVALAFVAVSAVEVTPVAEPTVATIDADSMMMCYKRCFRRFITAVWPTMRQAFESSTTSDAFMFYPFSRNFRDFDTMCTEYDNMKTCRAECGVVSEQTGMDFMKMFNFAEYACVKRRTEIKSFENCYNNVFGNKEFGEMCMNKCGGVDFFTTRMKDIVSGTGIFRADEMFTKIAAFTMSDEFCGCAQNIFECRRGQFISTCESTVPYNYYRTVTGMAFNSSITMMRRFVAPLVEMGIANFATVPQSCKTIMNWRKFDNMVTTTTTTTMTPTTTTTMTTTTTTKFAPTTKFVPTTTTIATTTTIVPIKEEVDFSVDNVAAEVVKEVVVDNMGM